MFNALLVARELAGPVEAVHGAVEPSVRAAEIIVHSVGIVLVGQSCSRVEFPGVEHRFGEWVEGC